MNENVRILPTIKQKPGFEEETGVKLEPGIKQEPGIMQDSEEFGSKIPLKKENREILMRFSNWRKKVVYLNESNSLLKVFNQHLFSDQSLSDLAFCGYPVFQEFNPKFNTWVDIDSEENLRDGAVVRVIYYNKEIQTDCSYSGSIKRKRDDCDIEPNPKQRRIDEESIKNDSYSWKTRIGNNELENVSPKRRSNICITGTRKCRTANKPRNRYSRNGLSVRKNLFPQFRSNSLDRWGSEGNLAHHGQAPSPVKEEKLWFLKPEENNMLVSRVPLLCVENQHANIPQSKSTVNDMPTKIQPLLFEENQGINFLESGLEPRASERLISWIKYLPTEMKQRRLEWGLQNICKIWWNTVFSDVGLFGLEGNHIKHYEKFSLSTKETEIFWGFCSYDGPPILAHLGFSLHASKFAEVLKSKVVRRVKDHYKSDVTLQFVGFWSQFDTNIVREVLETSCIFPAGWPSCAKDLSPIHHAWKLVGEKVKNIPCSSRQEMISLLTDAWEKDVDVQIMCSKVISLLPQIIESVIVQKGDYPKVNIRYGGRP